MSTQPKFTPGPWVVCSVEGDDSIVSAEQDRAAMPHEEPSIIGEINLAGDGIDVDVGMSNAHLIAAAPDLYAALEQLRSLRDQWRNDDRYSSLDYMDAIDALPWESALAKARGEVKP